MSFKKSKDFPEPPGLPTPAQILEDLKGADADDPVFSGSSETTNQGKSTDSFQIAQEFMTTTAKLKDLESHLASQKSQLQCHSEELRNMSENIRQLATEALSNIY